MKELGFGIVGCGVISDWHAGAIREIEGVTLVGATDRDKDSRERFAKKYDIAAFDTYEQMLACREIDVVCICTPSGLHAPMTVQAANAGKHIITEKPMALNLAQADGMIRACEENHVRCTVISQLRYTEAVSRLKDAVDRGLLGKLVMGNLYMKYYRSQEYYDSSSWRGTWEMDGGGALMNQGIHGIDLLLYIMGEVKSVFACTKTLARNIEVEDSAAAVLEFQNGALSTVQGATSIYPGFPRILEVNGSRGTIALKEDSIIKWEIEGQKTPEGIIPDPKDQKYRSERNPTDFGIEGHRKQIEDMVHAIREDRKPLVDIYEGRKPIELIVAVYESSRTGKPVFFE